MRLRRIAPYMKLSCKFSCIRKLGSVPADVPASRFARRFAAAPPFRPSLTPRTRSAILAKPLRALSEAKKYPWGRTRFAFTKARSNSPRGMTRDGVVSHCKKQCDTTPSLVIKIADLLGSSRSAEQGRLVARSHDGAPAHGVAVERVPKTSQSTREIHFCENLFAKVSSRMRCPERSEEMPLGCASSETRSRASGPFAGHSQELCGSHCEAYRILHGICRHDAYEIGQKLAEVFGI